MIPANAELILGRGELYFDRYLPGTMQGEGEMYLGNTPGFTISRSTDEVKRLRSYGGKLVATNSIVTQDKITAQITTDNISSENLALWFSAEGIEYQAGGSSTSETFVVKKGRFYQLGMSATGVGVRFVEADISFSKAGSSVAASNFVVDRTEGRFSVDPASTAISDGDTVTVTFRWRASDGPQFTSRAEEIVGALRYRAQNAYGPQISYYFPYVTLSPRNEIDLKADAFMSFSFDIDARRKNPATEIVYIMRHGEASYTAEEQDILDSGLISLDEFPYFDLDVHVAVNETLPPIVDDSNTSPVILLFSDGGEDFVLTTTDGSGIEHILVGG